MADEQKGDTSAPDLRHAQAWARLHELIDRQLCLLGLEAMRGLSLRRGDAVLDVGCGTGQSLVQLADKVGLEGGVVGVDISPLLLDVARRRTSELSQVRLVEADAQLLNEACDSFDAVFSRFGIMSFKDPVAAFRNFRRMLRPSGRLAFTCWRSFEENELDHLPLKAAGLELADDTPFSFADPGYVRQVLDHAGFTNIFIRPYNRSVSSGDIDAMTQVLLAVGPLGKLAREDPELRAAAEPRLRGALSAMGDPRSVCLRASVWVVTARV